MPQPLPTPPDRLPAALPADDDAGLRALLAREGAALDERRCVALEPAEGDAGAVDGRDARLSLPRIGLAISGGGVRSATFGLGLLRGLAQGRVLSRIDYLSTVSGGGFVGAMFGRMVAQVGITEAQAVLARGESPPLEWLRRNGRYLTPAGARDFTIAAVTYLRAIIAIHAESALACLPLVLLVLTPHLLLQGLDNLDPAGWQDWHTLWWPLALAGWLAVAPGAMTAYWGARDGPDPGRHRVAPAWQEWSFLVLFGLAVVAVSALAWPGPGVLAQGDAGALALVGGLLALWSCLVGLVYTPLGLLASQEPRALAVARLRNQLTRVLRMVTIAVAAMLAVGALDVTSWWLLEVVQSGENWVWGGVGLGGAAVVVMRTMAQPLQQLAEKAKAGVDIDWGPRLLNLAGALGLLALVLTWLVLAQWLVFAPEPLAALRDYAPGVRALALFGIAGVWWVLSASNDQMANASSLHSFYRARLTRAYLAVGNLARGMLAAAGAAPAEAPATSVRDVMPGDDIDLLHYRPELRGGPIHLVNACLNQTRDDASGLYNADRKGAVVTASAHAIEVGPREVVALDGSVEIPPGDVGTLGRWIAVSGAAASPGAGSYTSPGWALLLFFLGVRLGYWSRAPKAPSGGWPPALLRCWTWAVKPLMLWSEVAASFFGRARPWWYLSDGGHFDNTGVYALLKRRLDFIVLADNSADADYRFGDLENLVRKARIDFGAEIEFYTRDEAARHFAGGAGDITVLSPEIMADNHSARGVMLARVRYAPAADGSRAEATLLVVKPNLHDALDLDLLAYAQRHPAFPHESTGDQSFDEAKWESYHRLGEDFGRALKLDWLAQLPGWSRHSAHPMTVAARLNSAATAPAAAAVEPLWRRSARATAIGATLGLSASGTILLGAWQVSEQLRKDSAAEQAEAQRLFTEVSRDLRDLDGACPKVADHTAVQLMMLRDLRKSPRLRPLEREGVGQLIEHVREECDQQPAPSIDCAEAWRRAAAGVCAVANKPPSEGTALSYWHSTPARVTLAGLFGRRAADVSVASAPLPAPGGVPAEAVAPPEAPRTRSAEPAPLAPRPPLTTRGEGPAEATPAPPAPVSPPAGAEPASTANACGQGDHPLRLYVQIYDEASREAAAAAVRALQKDPGEVLRIAPVENVTRSAQLRDKRRPVPWPQPTLIVHDPADRACAAELAATIRGALPAAPGRDGGVWVRELPRSLNPSSGVIELWIPPREAAAKAAG